MNLLVFLSDRCNMACDYCFLSLNRGPAHVLDPAAALRAAEELAARPEGLERVTLLGGEPLIHFDRARAVVEGILARFPQAKVGLVTNGTLLCPEKLDWLLERGVDVSVSLDGEPEAHDRHRRLWPGGAEPGAPSLAASLLALEGCGPRVRALRANMVVSEDTAPHLVRGVESLRRLGFRSVSFHVRVGELWTEEGLRGLASSLSGFSRYWFALDTAAPGALRIAHLQSYGPGTRSCEDPSPEALVLGADGRFYPSGGVLAHPYREARAWSVGEAAAGMDWARLGAVLDDARRSVHAALGGMRHSSCPLEAYFLSRARGEDPGPSVRAFYRAENLLAETLAVLSGVSSCRSSGSGGAAGGLALQEAGGLAGRGDLEGAFRVLAGGAGPSFSLRPRDPRQDLQYGPPVLTDDPGPYLRAAKQAEGLIRAFPRASSPRLLLGAAEAFSGPDRIERSLEALEAAVRLAVPEGLRSWALAWRGVARSLLARVRRTQEGLRDALADFDEAIRLGSASGFARPWRAELRHDLEDPSGALEDLAAIPRQGPDGLWARVERGEILCETGKLEEALAEFDRLVEERPAEPWPLALRGRTLATSGHEAQGLRDLESAVRAGPRSAAYRTWLAEALRKLGRYREALDRLDEAVRLEPGYTLAWIWRGRVRLVLGEPAAALPDLEEAVRLDPRYLLGWAWKGEALFKLGRFWEAAEAFGRIRPMDPRRTWNPVLREGERLGPGAREGAFLDAVRRAAVGPDPSGRRLALAWGPP